MTTWNIQKWALLNVQKPCLGSSFFFYFFLVFILLNQFTHRFILLSFFLCYPPQKKTRFTRRPEHVFYITKLEPFIKTNDQRRRKKNNGFSLNIPPPFFFQSILLITSLYDEQKESFLFLCV